MSNYESAKKFAKFSYKVKMFAKKSCPKMKNYTFLKSS